MTMNEETSDKLAIYFRIILSTVVCKACDTKPQNYCTVIYIVHMTDSDYSWPRTVQSVREN